MKVAGKILDGVEEIKHLTFCAMVVTALGAGICFAAGMYTAEKIGKMLCGRR